MQATKRVSEIASGQKFGLQLQKGGGEWISIFEKEAGVIIKRAATSKIQSMENCISHREQHGDVYPTRTGLFIHGVTDLK